MTDLPRVQRVLFRMQHDATFAGRLRAREAEALLSAGLAEDDLALLLGAPRAGVEADPDGRRLAQLLRNVTSEFMLSAAHALRGADAELVASFPSSPQFHRCMAEEGRLPLAFGEHALQRAGGSGDALLGGLASVELAMARLRRADVPRRAAARHEIVLAGHADALSVPAGTMEAAGLLRAALDAGDEAVLPPAPRSSKDAQGATSRTEHVLVVAAGACSPLRLRDVAVEELAELAGELLLLARAPVTPAALASFRALHAVEEADLDEFIDSLRADRLVECA